MADSAEQVAVESAASAATSAMIADNAAGAAQQAAAEIQTAQTEATVEVAQAAVALAQVETAIVTAEAAAVIRDAEQSIAEIEGDTKWQGEAIKTLQTQQSEVQKQLENLTLAVRELVTPESVNLSDSSQSIPPNSETPENPPPTVEPAAVAVAVAENPPNADADAQKAAANQAAQLEAKRKRVLRFL
jgi:hypothetical protein